jgi:pyruvate,water dikinase
MREPVELRHAEDEGVFGGKSVQLGASLRDGLPVPPGWALAVAFVDAVVRGDADARAVLASFLQDKPYAFAVRSSGVGEDAKIASFAGQHFTELNRIGLEDIVGAIRSVWESGHSPGACAYRAKLGITGTPRVAVTLQKMIFPDCAGVMFTRHPLTGADEIVVEASWGLGEAIVEGLVIPDHFRFRKDGALIERRAGTKDVVFKALPGGGVEEATIADPEKVNGFCLDDVQLGALVQLALRCERHFGTGRDIEWGIQDGALYLLQCRAITTGRTA